MDVTDWEPLKQLFERASALPAEDQKAFLEDACADDPNRQAQLASLLAAAEDADPFFDSLADALLSLSPSEDDSGQVSPPTSTPKPEPLIGRSVRQYRIEAELGRGGMGIVYRAHDTILDRAVALKFLPHRMTGDEAATERFRVEARAAAALDHPNVCTVHEIGEDDDGRLFIAMAHYEGETLQKKLERGPVPTDEALDYTRQIAAGLEAAHAQDIVHRDIKPGNVIVTPDGVAKVLDFGLAKLTDVALTGTGTTLGTVAYMSPEQIEGGMVDHRTDLWSLGVVLYELLAGERPFKGARPAVVIDAIQRETPEPVRAVRPEAPPALESAVARLLSKDPANRYPNVGEFARVLDGLARPAAPRGPLARVGTAVPFVLALYAASGWLVLQITERVAGRYVLPGWVSAGALLLLLIGLPITLAATFAQTLGGRRAHPIILTLRRFLRWRHALRGGVAAFALLGIASGLYSLSRALGIGPAATLVSRGTIGERALLILADFESGDPDLARLVTEAFRIDLSQSRIIRLAQPGQLRAALGRMGREPGVEVDLGLAQEVAQREGASGVVVGEIHAAGGQFLLAAQLLTPDGLEALASGRETARDSAELLEAIDRLSLSLRERIGESTRSLRADPPLARVTTSNLEALRRFSQAREVEATGEYERALALFQEAVAVDTTFAMGYRALAIRLGNMGRAPSRQRAALTKAFEHRDRLTEYERYSVMADYHRVVTRDLAKAIEAYEGRLSLNPNDVGALNNIGYMKEMVRDFEGAEAYYQRSMQTGTSGRIVYTNLAMTQASQGKFEEARATIAAAFERWPGDSNTGLYAGWVEAAAGDYAAAAAYFGAGGGSATGLAPVGLAAVSAATGRLTDAEAYERAAMDAAEERKNASTVLRHATRLAYLDILLRDDPIRGLRTVVAALERHPLATLPPLDRPYLSMAAAYAIAGRPEQARELMEEFENEVEAPDRGTWYAGDSELFRVRGRIALAEGRYQDAIELFRRSDEGVCLLCALPGLGESFERVGQPDSAIAVYERYVSTPDARRIAPPASEPERTPVGDRYFLGPILERLGRLYDERGDLESAALYYARFVELWAEADGVLQPRVRAAQRRLAEIVAEMG